MSPRLIARPTRARMLRICLVALVLAFAASLAGYSAARASRDLDGAVENQTAQAALTQLSLQANDLVYDPSSQRIYASVGASGGERANTITPINPSTGALEAGISVGSDPRRLALSDNGQYLYVGLDGEGNVRRVELATRTPGLQFSLGTTLFDRYNRAQDMAVIPGHPGSLVVARHEGFGTHTGLVVYDDGAARPKMPDVTTEPCNDIELNETGTLVFGLNTQNTEAGFRKLSVDADGITLVSRAYNLFHVPGMKYQNGRVYAPNGEVVDTATMSLAGKFSAGGVVVAPDVANNRVYFIGIVSGESALSVLAYDANTSQLVGKLALAGVNGAVKNLIRWGASGLAFNTDGGQVFLLNTSDIPAPPPTPLPTPTQLAQGVVRLTLAANDLAYDPATQKVYASVPSRAGTYGNSIAPLDPSTASVGTPVPIGGEPGKLGVARTGQHIYAGLDGPGHIRRFDTLSQTAGAEFSLGAGSNGTLYARDIEVSPDNTDVIAVARYNKVVSPSGEGVAVYDGGVKRPNEITRNEFVNVIEFSGSGSTVYGYDNGSTENFLYKLAVNSNGVTVAKKTGVISGAGDIRFADGLLYATNGQVADPEAFKIVGSVAAVGPVLPDPVSGRLYVLARDNNTGAVTLFAFDMHTLVPVGFLNVPGVSGNATTLVRAGADSLAFRTTADQVYFLRLSAMQGYSAPPVGPVPRTDGVRQVSLAANDFVFNPLDGQVYVSVPSYAGSRGNSITTIDPSTGAVGPSTFVGSEPDVLAVSVDGHQLYVSLFGSASVRRFDAATKTPGLTFDLGRSNDPTVQHFGPRYARALAVVPGNPNAVAVARYYPAIGSGDGIYVYDDGVPRPKGSFGRRMEFTEDGTLLAYNGDNTEFGLRKYSLAADGFTETANGTGVMSGFSTNFKYAAGRVYGDEGSVVETAGVPTRVGKFATPPGRLVAASASDAVVYYIRTDTFGGVVNVEAYDKNTFVLVGACKLTGMPNGATILKFARYGADGLAFMTNDGQLFFFSTSLVQTLPPMPLPTPVQVADGIRYIPIDTNDLAYDRASGMVYASVPSRAMDEHPMSDVPAETRISYGNTVVPLDPSTAAAGAPVFVGSEPRKLAVSRDGQFLYAALDATGEVRRVHIPSQTAGLRFPLITPSEFATGLVNDLPRVTDMEVMPGSPGTVAVARWVRAVIYDEGVPRPVYTNLTGLERTSAIEFSSSPSTLYALDNDTTDFGVYKMAVDSSGVHTVAKANGFFEAFGADMKFDAGRLYTTTGKVINPETLTATGQFPGMGEVTQSGLVCPDSSVNRVFFLKNSGFGGNLTIVAYDRTTLQQTGSLVLPFAGEATSFLRWGADGFVFRTFDPITRQGARVYFVRTSLVPPRVVGPNSVQFDAAAKSVNEGTWELTVKVTRTGDTADPATVSYSTTDATATETSDYTAALGTLRFAPGETEKTFPVLISTDAFAEADETFNVTLKNPQGTTLGSPGALTVTIKDAGTPTGPSPVRWDSFDASFFVRRHYLDFLNRNPDASGLQFWTNELNSCGTNTQCREVKRVNVSAAFFLSIEFRETGYFVYKTYKVAFGDITGKPVPVTLKEFLQDTQAIGKGVVVGQGNWQAQLDANKQSYALEFVRSRRFKDAYPASMSPEAFISKLDANAGGVLDATERTNLVDELSANNTDAGRASVLRKVAEDSDLDRREKNRAFVLMQYFGYLRRNPDDAPEEKRDFTGYNFWLTKLNQFGGNFVTAEMVKAFITSDEYVKRFGQ